MNKFSSILGIAAIMAMGDMSISTGGTFENIESEDEREKRLKKAELKNNKAHGLKEFKYPDGSSEWAINQKNADKKYRKRI